MRLFHTPLKVLRYFMLALFRSKLHKICDRLRFRFKTVLLEIRLLCTHHIRYALFCVLDIKVDGLRLYSLLCNFLKLSTGLDYVFSNWGRLQRTLVNLLRHNTPTLMPLIDNTRNYEPSCPCFRTFHLLTRHRLKVLKPVIPLIVQFHWSSLN
jgi:hypothetical protein